MIGASPVHPLQELVEESVRVAIGLELLENDVSVVTPFFVILELVGIPTPQRVVVFAKLKQN